MSFDPPIRDGGFKRKGKEVDSKFEFSYEATLRMFLKARTKVTLLRGKLARFEYVYPGTLEDAVSSARGWFFLVVNHEDAPSGFDLFCDTVPGFRELFVLGDDTVWEKKEPFNSEGHDGDN